jgi:lipoprotein-anchoring transpeptidase ErfK/SrfK
VAAQRADLADRDPGVAPAPGEDVMDAAYHRQPVFYRTEEKPGTIIIDTSDRFLYLIQATTWRCATASGSAATASNGRGCCASPASPNGRTGPPPEMIQRQPYLPRFMAGGPGNPMGARALYLGNTVYRIHGTNAPETIGHAVSSGCFRLVNDEIADLYTRVAVGTKVVVQH